MKVLLKRLDNEAELVEVEDFRAFCQKHLYEQPSSDGRLWIHVGDVFNRQTFVMYVSCMMQQSGYGDEHFVLHRPSQWVKEMQTQLIYGHVFFAKVDASDDSTIRYIDMTEEEAQAISSCFTNKVPYGLGYIELLEFEQIYENLNDLYETEV